MAVHVSDLGEWGEWPKIDTDLGRMATSVTSLLL